MFFKNSEPVSFDIHILNSSTLITSLDFNIVQFASLFVSFYYEMFF